MNIAIIPARSGSGRIADKNICPMLGQPMLGWPLAAAARSGLFRTLHVSTDSPRYAEVAAELGHPVGFLRPPELARNDSSLFEMLRWTVRQLEEGGHPAVTTICMIYATAVLLEPEDIVEGHRQLLAHPERGPVMTVVRTLGPWERALRVDADGVLRWIEPAARFLHSQQCAPAYFDAAGFLFFTRAQLFGLPAEGDAAVPTDFHALELPAWRVCDINDPPDLEFALRLLMGREVASRPIL